MGSALLQREQILQNVALFLRRAGALQNIIAVAFEPLLDFGGIGKALRVRARSKRCDGLARLRVFTLLYGRLCMAGRTTPVVGVARLEELLATLRGEATERLAAATHR